MDFTEKTPAELGYRMPAEWEPHAATWLSWPRREGISFPESFDQVLPALRAMVAALVESEPVCINVINGAHEAEARAVLDALPQQECITYYEIPTNEPWCRDHGPIFVTRDADPKLAIVDWDYNAWGNKYPPFDLDEVVPTRIAEILKVPVFYPRMILEGGSIEVNGAGVLLTSESCLLNKNRNPGLSRDEIEQRLRGHLGIREILWLGDGVVGVANAQPSAIKHSAEAQCHDPWRHCLGNWRAFHNRSCVDCDSRAGTLRGSEFSTRP